jgi:hypothetical protein
MDVAAEKTILTLIDACMLNTQVDKVPLQAPLQPEKVNPAGAAAAKVMLLPLLNILLQLATQELPSEKPAAPVPAIVRFRAGAAPLVPLTGAAGAVAEGAPLVPLEGAEAAPLVPLAGAEGAPLVPLAGAEARPLVPLPPPQAESSVANNMAGKKYGVSIFIYRTFAKMMNQA